MFMLKVTDQISLKLLGQRDANELYDLVDDSRGNLRQWLPWVDSMIEPEQYGPIISAWLEQFAAEDGFQAGILFNGNLAGMAGFHSVNQANKQTSIGYWLAEPYQGNGIMTEVVRSLLDYAFDEYVLHRVEIRCGTEMKRVGQSPNVLDLLKKEFFVMLNFSMIIIMI